MPTLVVHGDSDAIVPIEVSGERTARAGRAAASSSCIERGPHGINASHAEEFNRAVLDFLAR